MKRNRTRAEWVVYCLTAGILLMAASVVMLLISRSELQQEIGMLNDRLEQHDELGVGGAEVPIPSFKPAGPEWQFPIAESDYRVLTSPFGYRISPLLHVEMYHTGLDIAATWKAQVVAVADGVVIEHWPPPDGYYRGHDVYGGMIKIEHEDGMKTLYGHLSWSRVNTGDIVQAGEVIGRIGNTGRSDGQHLHIGVMGLDGQWLNPLLYFGRPE